MESEAGTIIRVIVVCEREDEDITREEFDLAPAEVRVVAPLILAMRPEHPQEDDRTG